MKAVLAAGLFFLAAFSPQVSGGLSQEAQAAVDVWRAKVQDAAAAANARPAQTMAGELERRLRIEQTARMALGAVGESGLSQEHYRLAMDRIWKDIDALDADNTQWLKANLPADGWFRISRDGESVASGAWLIVQHSPDKEWQKEILARMEPLVSIKEVNGGDYALLYDRTEMFEGRPQRYGSQGVCRDGTIVIHDLEDSERIDELRASVGLGPHEEYKKLLGIGRSC